MSGGSLEFLYYRVEQAAEKVQAYWKRSQPGDPPGEHVTKGLAFASLLFLVAKALKEMEWEMSGDGTDWVSLDALIGPKEETAEMASELKDLIAQAELVMAKLTHSFDRRK